jgi:hypothetical protein
MRGALAGVEGIVVRKKSGLQVVLTLSLLMQSIAIEVSGDDVELVGSDYAGAHRLNIDEINKSIEDPAPIEMP